MGAHLRAAHVQVQQCARDMGGDAHTTIPRQRVKNVIQTTQLAELQHQRLLLRTPPVQPHCNNNTHVYVRAQRMTQLEHAGALEQVNTLLLMRSCAGPLKSFQVSRVESFYSAW
jgi:hypothetical protein